MYIYIYIYMSTALECRNSPKEAPRLKVKSETPLYFPRTVLMCIYIYIYVYIYIHTYIYTYIYATRCSALHD